MSNAAETPAAAPAYEVIWPDGGTYANRDGKTRLSVDEARATARAIGGRWRLASLDHLDETIRFDGAEWMTEGPRGALHLIRWFSKSGNVVAWRMPGTRSVHRGLAQSIEGARGEAVRMAALIADGKAA
jgi:hypothetical protein